MRQSWVAFVGGIFALAGAGTIAFSQSFGEAFLGFVSLVLGTALCYREVRRSRVPWTVVASVLIGIASISFRIYEFDRLSSGQLRASDYPQLQSRVGDLLGHFPAEVPDDARDVKLVAYGPWGLLPAIDYFIELKFKVSPARAKQIASEAAQRAVEIKTLAGDGIGVPAVNGFASDFSGDPAKIECYSIVPPRAEKSGGVCVDLVTGEVLYWVTD